VKYTIEVTLPDGRKEIIEGIQAPNQRDAHLIARRHATGLMNPPDLDTKIVEPRHLADGFVAGA